MPLLLDGLLSGSFAGDDRYEGVISIQGQIQLQLFLGDQKQQTVLGYRTYPNIAQSRDGAVLVVKPDNITRPHIVAKYPVSRDRQGQLPFRGGDLLAGKQGNQNKHQDDGDNGGTDIKKQTLPGFFNLTVPLLNFLVPGEGLLDRKSVV